MLASLPQGCLTAMVTPFKGKDIDWLGLKQNIEFQISEGISGLVMIGTTGESPTLTNVEHILVMSVASLLASRRVFMMAGCGSNSTQEALHYTESASNLGYDGVLLVDCYYNGPSSFELLREYYLPIAQKYLNLQVVPYIIPGRTGCALSTGDLAKLASICPNVRSVKDARNNLQESSRTRIYMPDNFVIYSGDDDATFDMMADASIKGGGVISVMSNIAPAAIQRMCRYAVEGDFTRAEALNKALAPLFKAVTVKAKRESSYAINGHDVSYCTEDKFRNPLAIKTMMQGLGMPAGFCRQPLGLMTWAGVEQVREALKTVWTNNPEILMPIQDFYRVDIAERLDDVVSWIRLAYSV